MVNARALSATLDALLSESVVAADCPDGVPGVVAMVTDRDRTLYAGAAGVRVFGEPQPMTTDTVVCLWSATKAITGVAVMQLVEEGRIALDDRAATYVPEIAELRVLDGFADDGEPHLRPPRSAITLRQLLLHTAGFGYDFFNADLRRFSQRRRVPTVTTATMAALRTCLLFDPGARWEYGIGIDWAGKVVESVTGARLGEVVRERICAPLEMPDTSFTLSPAMRARRAALHHRTREGGLRANAAFELPSEPEQHMGGHGMYGTAGDYLQLIRLVLNDGLAADGRRVLGAATVRAMSASGLGALAVHRLPGVDPRLTHDVEFFPGVPTSWGLTWLINEAAAPTGRSPGSLAWAGLANVFYWIDRARGIGGVWACQLLPFFDPAALAAYLAFETAVYDWLRSG